ncbi:hypothetical protein [Arthrobacter sp. Cr_A7]|uniref:hypothetical protein n=1 Tax=Arthrobacter sp. Cr_A7 TaxID=3031017 RepID=UPI0023DA000E|nr:hypothetical protein [Arthrobacter sp. Cr_A7]
MNYGIAGTAVSAEQVKCPWLVQQPKLPMAGSRRARQQAVAEHGAHQVRGSTWQCNHSMPQTKNFAARHRLPDIPVFESCPQEGGCPSHGACLKEEMEEVHEASRPNLGRPRQGGWAVCGQGGAEIPRLWHGASACHEDSPGPQSILGLKMGKFGAESF